MTTPATVRDLIRHLPPVTWRYRLAIGGLRGLGVLLMVAFLGTPVLGPALVPALKAHLVTGILPLDVAFGVLYGLSLGARQKVRAGRALLVQQVSAPVATRTLNAWLSERGLPIEVIMGISQELAVRQDHSTLQA